MAKKIVQDVLPPERSIRNIPLSAKARSSADEPKTRSRRTSPVSTALNSRTRSTTGGRSVVDEEKVRPTNRDRRSGGGRSRVMLWSIAVVCFLVVVFSCSFLFVSATVRVTPKQWPLPINLQLEAAKNSETLPYSLITVSREASRTVPASGEESVEEKASGLITIFNTQGTQVQKLVKNTRFESPTGLIYRIQDAVTVPGVTTKAGATVPGSVTVKVVADKAGPEYNIGLSDFTIPGFKGDPKYKTLTAKSDPSSPIRGGFIGKIGKVKDSDLQVAYAAMEKELTEALNTQVGPQVPDHQLYFVRTGLVTFEKMPVAAATGTSSVATTATVKEKGTLTAVLFDRAKLVAAIGANLPKDAEGLDLEIKQWDSVNFSFKNSSEAKLVKGEPIQFTLQGNVIPSAQIDPEEIKNELAAKPRSAFGSVLSGIPSVAQAELKIRPVWAWTLPKNPEKITVTTVEP